MAYFCAAPITWFLSRLRQRSRGTLGVNNLIQLLALSRSSSRTLCHVFAYLLTCVVAYGFGA